MNVAVPETGDEDDNGDDHAHHYTPHNQLFLYLDFIYFIYFSFIKIHVILARG